ncbi:hypothetical protein [uncultured Sphingomonas sp.]|uniref:HNH endonuclease n=1 Tax=uncultured Sphingomonas sp. TaxID=158754 RepID=UPI0025E2DBB9|nr:hypothetical protein [uncultured Sphingomonas sp.]
MRKLDLPAYGVLDLYDAATREITDPALRAKFAANRSEIEPAFNAYYGVSSGATWHNLPRALWGQEHQLVVGQLTKGELNSLYSTWVVKTAGDARRIYDAIKISSGGECPYCGGVSDMGEEGELGTLDHFLPKAYFPTYSTHPFNLVPACAVCNKGMHSSFPVAPDKQPLHPYMDADMFFSEQWARAVVREGVPVVVDFDVDAPNHWNAVARGRIIQHFSSCNLRKRYRSRVSQEVIPLIDQRNTSLRDLSVDQFRAHLAVVSVQQSLPINGWKRTLYRALAASDWFCSYDFT